MTLPALPYGVYISPARTYDANLDDLYLLQSSPTADQTTLNALHIYKISGYPAATANFYDVGPTSPTNAWTSRFDEDLTHPGVHGAPQLNHSNSIRADDDRIHSCFYRNGSLWAAHTVFAPAGNNPTVSAVQWWQVSIFPSISVVQRACLGCPAVIGVLGIGEIVDVLDEDKFKEKDPGTPSAPPFRAYPTLAVNATEDVLIGYSFFSLNDAPSAAYSFRLGTDSLSSLHSEIVSASGEDFFQRHEEVPLYRWGDFSAAAVDPINDRDLWTIQEYSGSLLINAPSGPTPPPNTGWKTFWVGALKTFARFTAGETYGFGQRLMGPFLLSAAGDNTDGQLGNGDPVSCPPCPTPSYQPVGVSLPLLPPTGNGKIIDVAAGTYTSLAVGSNGTVYVWGRNQFGLFGNGSLNDPPQTANPTPVPNLQLFANNHYRPLSTSFGNSPSIIGANWGNCAAVDDSGHVKTWGLNNDGQLGDGTTTNRPYPGLVRGNDPSLPFTPLTGVVSIAVGPGQMMALKADGTVWAWGRGDRGALGDGLLGQHNQLYPQQVKIDQSHFLSNVARVVCGASDFSLALTTDGKIYGWGQNGLYQLGLGSNATDHEYATLINYPGGPFPGGADRIAAGAYHSLAHSTSDGKVYAWGSNGWGQGGFGSGQTILQPVPRPMAEPNSGFTDIAAGAFFSFMIHGRTEDVFGTGDNQFGQLAVNDTVTRYLPVPTLYHP